MFYIYTLESGFGILISKIGQTYRTLQKYPIIDFQGQIYRTLQKCPINDFQGVTKR